jgi:hypothetical protein
MLEGSSVTVRAQCASSIPIGDLDSAAALAISDPCESRRLHPNLQRVELQMLQKAT